LFLRRELGLEDKRTARSKVKILKFASLKANLQLESAMGLEDYAEAVEDEEDPDYGNEKYFGDE
jgi:hypothetical protein